MTKGRIPGWYDEGVIVEGVDISKLATQQIENYRHDSITTTLTQQLIQERYDTCCVKNKVKIDGYDKPNLIITTVEARRKIGELWTREGNLFNQGLGPLMINGVKICGDEKIALGDLFIIDTKHLDDSEVNYFFSALVMVC